MDCKTNPDELSGLVQIISEETQLLYDEQIELSLWKSVHALP